MAFDPKYIPFAIYREGGFKKKSFFDYFKQEKGVHIAKQQAMFRCDTFIQYSYLKGARILITELVPALLFKSFKYTREALPLLDNVHNFIFNQDSPKMSDCSSAECYKNLIENLISQEATVDEIMLILDEYGSFLNDKEKFDSYVFKKYLETFKNRKLNDALLDFIIEHEPTDELIGNLIDMYSSSNFLPYTKSSIFRQFEYLFVYEPDESFELSSKRIKNINRANEIVIDILQHSNNISEVIIACNIADQIMAGEHSQQLIMDALNRIYSQNNSSIRKIKEDLLINQILNNDFKSQELKIKDDGFNRKLLLILKHIEIQSLSSKTIALLRNYLIKIHKIESIEHMTQKQIHQFLDKEILWMSAYKKIDGKNNYLDLLNLFDKKTGNLLQKVLNKK